MKNRLQQIRYRIDGVECASCVTRIDTVVRRLPGVEDVSVSIAARTMTVHFRGDMDLATQIKRKVEGLGYQLTVADGLADSRTGPRDADDGQSHSESDHSHNQNSMEDSWWKSRKGQLTIACGLAVGTAWVISKLLPGLEPWIFTVAMLVGLIPIARRAITAAIAGSPFTIETLMTIAAVGAVIIGASEEAAAVVFLFLIGELLEGVAAGKARASIQALTELVPKIAFLEENGQTREVQADSLAIGSIILVRPGDRIPADGVILSGESAIDEAPVTGESVPVRKGVDAVVFAGTVNGDAALRIRVTTTAADNTIARVVRLVEEAQESKAPTQRFIDRFSRYYTPGVLVAGALVAVFPPLFSAGTGTNGYTKG